MNANQVFVSHTSDMASFPAGRSYVQAALDSVVRAGKVPVDMRYFPAQDRDPADYCWERVSGCEIYMAVIGFRYGSLVPGETISYTELEFAAATAAGLPRLVFLLERPAALPASMADADQSAIAGFRGRLQEAGLIVRSFTSQDNLELEIFHAFAELGRSRPVPGARPLPTATGLRFSIPPATAAFTGREAELAHLMTAATHASGKDAPAAIQAIGGMPGVGKTALAVYAAHRLRSEFPDRCLYIDLHAHTSGRLPLTAANALAQLLTAVGVDARYLPTDLTSRADLWRDRLDGQRVLLVLDNAASSSQVTPLLPGGSGCLTLITSRRHLGDLPGAPDTLQLDSLPPRQAQEMLVRLAPRAAAGPAALVAELARLAGHLPLAISLLARAYTRHASWTLADLVAETTTSMLTLTAEENSLAAIFEVSYRYLTPDQQQFLRLLSMHPGASIDAYAAAALAGLGLTEVRDLLNSLDGEGLLTETGYRRYGMHDLIRRYASDRAATDPAAGERALDRLMDYYQRTGALAEKKLARQTIPVSSPAQAGFPGAVPNLPDSPRALRWARDERANLLTCLDHATRAGQFARVSALTAAIASLLRQDGPWGDAIARHAVAADAARFDGDRLSRAGALSQLGIVRRLTSDYPGAIRDLEEALGIYRELGNKLGEANVLNNLGRVWWRTDQYPEASDACSVALDIYRDIGEQLGTANALSDLGVVLWRTGDYPSAAQALEEALGICRELGDRPGEANALGDLGTVRWLTDDYPGAAQALDDAVRICRELGDRLGLASALNQLGVVRLRTGQYEDAVQAQEEALGLCRDLGDRRGQAVALNDLAAVRWQSGDYPGAASDLDAALRLSRDVDDRLGRANALSNLGAVRRRTAQYAAAEEALDEALGIYRELGDLGGQVEALNEAGALYRTIGDLNRAEAAHRQALNLARQIGSPWDEAQSLAGLARWLLATGDQASAQANLRQALAIFQRTGVAEADRIATELAALTHKLTQ